MISDTIIQAAMGTVLLFMMFSMGLVLTWQDFRRVAQTPLTVALGLFAQIILLPAAAFLTIRALDLPAAPAIGLLLVAVCPSGPICNFFSYLAGGDLALSLTLTASATLLHLFTMPAFFMFTLLGSHAGGPEVPALYIVKTLFLIIILPTLAGMLLRARRPAFAAGAVRYTSKIAPALILLVVAALLVRNRAVLRDIGGLLLAAVCLMNAGGMLAGYAWGGLFRRGTAVKRTFIFETSQQNIPLAITLSYGMYAADAGQLAVILSVVVLYGATSLISALAGALILKGAPGRADTAGSEA